MTQSIIRHPDYIRADEFVTRRDYEAGRLIAEEAISKLSDIDSEIHRLSLELLRAECLAFTGRHNQAIEVSERAIDSLRSGGDHDLYARACFVTAVALYHLGEMDRAYEVGSLALYASKRAESSIGVIKALNWLGNIVFYKSEFERAITFFSECAKTATEADLPQFAAVASGNIARALVLTGRLTAARDHFISSRRGLERHLHRVSVLRNELSVSFLNIQLRAFEPASESLKSLECEIFESNHLREQGAWCEYRAELELAQGNLLAAETHLKRGIEIASGGSRDESVIGQSRRLLAEVRLAERNYEQAICEADRALESIRKVGERFEEGVVYRVLGEALNCTGRHSEARAAYKHSIDILRTIGANLEWAKTCLAVGRSDVFSRRERLAFLVEAERLFAEIGVGYWIDQTRDELKSVMKDREQELLAQSPIAAQPSQPAFVSANRATLETVRIAERLARTDIAVLITGETGVGKDQLSRHIHACSPRRAAKFVTIDLSALPESLWESEVFGHRKGVFTGATCDKIGLLESANGGTVFLNEIGNLPLPFQAKLLEMLDSRRIRRVGDTDTRALDVRFVAATNVNLPEAVAQGQFRRDLYYRLAEAPLHLKPLRERREDIIPLLKHFLLQRGVPLVDLELLDRQLWVDRAYNGHWAGNVRQLESFVHRLVAIAERPADPAFPIEAETHLEAVDIIHEPNVGGKVTRASLLAALDRNNGNQRATARDLGITEGGVRHLMRRFGVHKSDS